MTQHPCGWWSGCSCAGRAPSNGWGASPAVLSAANDDDASQLSSSIALEARMVGVVDDGTPPDSDDPDAEPVFTYTAEVFRDGSVRSLSEPRADFHTTLRAMMALRDSLDADLRAGPAKCPFSPRNRKAA